MNPTLQKHIIVILLVALLLAGCGTAPATASAVSISVATTVPTMTWLGMQYPTDSWRAETVEENFLFYGLLTHLALPHCQVMVLAESPLFIMDRLPELTSYESLGWPDPTSQRKTTNRLIVNLLTVKDAADQEQLFYYEVFDKTGFFGFNMHRLGYFLVSRSSDTAACGKAFWDVLITLQVDHWIPLPVAQG